MVDGWNVTGDMMRALPDGRLVCLGRADDLILTAGYTVSGAEVEAVLIEHPAVRRLRRLRHPGIRSAAR